MTNLNERQVYELGQVVTKGAASTSDKRGQASGFSTMPNNIRGRGFMTDERGRGTIFIASDYRGDKNRVYTHELGNILSNRLTGDPNTFGNRKYRDHDTGENLEHAVFGSGSGP